MVKRMIGQLPFSFTAGAVLIVGILAAGMSQQYRGMSGGRAGHRQGFNPISSTNVTRVLIPYRDPWLMVKPRFWDINDEPLTQFLANRKFTYHDKQITVTYDTAPAVPYFVGHIEARGLKPNFAYQMKLIGKPKYGSRGWGAFSDDTTNERLGLAGRWWDDLPKPPGTNIDDKYHRNLYKKAPLNRKHTIYGYLYMGTFVTDENGNADVDVDSSHSYHVAWQDKQIKGRREVLAGTWIVQSTTPPYYGYVRPIPPKQVKLWYEYQSGRFRNVILPPGSYNCRFLITEDTFHNLMGHMNHPNGGFYQSVLVNEDFDARGNPDSDPSNDITFTIGG